MDVQTQPDDRQEHKGAPSKKVGVHKEGSPYSDAECEQIIAKLEQMLDGELDLDKEKDFVDMVNNCEYCLEQFHIEKSLRSMLKEGFRNLMVNNTLVQNIKNSLRAVRGR